MNKPDMQVPGNPLDAMMEKAMGHCGIKQPGDHPTMKDIFISLEPTVALELRSDKSVVSALEVQF